MERRLARGADKCIHAVPGLLEACFLRDRAGVEVDLGSCFGRTAAASCLSTRPIGATVARQIQS